MSTAEGPPETAAHTIGDFDLRRSALLRALDQLELLARDRGEIRIADLLSEASFRLADRRFTLVVLGEFKRGKSTLINALLDAEVMPVGVVPLTSVVVTVEYGASEECVVRFRDGRREWVPLNLLADYGTERGNPANRKGVHRITVRHPAVFLRGGIILVDTPGIGSMYRDNTATTYDYLSQADAAVFMLSVDPPASDVEISFLKDVRTELRHIFFVLNKVDLVQPNELRESCTFISRVLAQTPGVGRHRIFALSAEQREAGFKEFKAAVEHFLAVELETLLLEQAAEEARSAERQLDKSIALEEECLSLPLGDLRRRLQAFHQQTAEIARRQGEADSHLAADARRLITEELDPAIETFRREGTRRVHEVIERTVSERGSDLGRRIETAVQEEVRSLLSVRAAELGEMLSQRLAEIGRRYADRAGQLAGEITELSASIFDLPLVRVAHSPQLESPSRFAFRFEDQLPAQELASYGGRQLVPGALRKKLARRWAEEIVKRHSGALRHDLVERVKEQERTFRRQLGSRTGAVRAGAARAVELATKAQESGPQAEEREQWRLTDQRQILSRIKDSYQTVGESGEA